MADYLKKKIKSNRKKSKGVIQYEEINEETTEDLSNNLEDYENDDTIIQNIMRKVGSRNKDDQDYQEDRIDSQEDDNYKSLLINGIRSQTINIPADYALQLDQNSSLFQTIDINDDENNDTNMNNNSSQSDRWQRQQHKNFGSNSSNESIIDRDIIVESDCWPEHQEAQVKSTIHKLLRREMTQIDPSKIYFSEIDKLHLAELKQLHEEWFPLIYPDTFYNKIHKRKILAIGCFIDLDEDNRNVILGTILVNIKNNNDEIVQMYQAKDYSNSGMFGWLRQTITCREYQAAYIMTLGVVDECRRMGLGSMLLNEAIKTLQVQNTASEVIYLHVVDYNETAIRFYEKNDFRMLKRIKDHYLIFEKPYDALVLYKDIKQTDANLNQIIDDVESNINNSSGSRSSGLSSMIGYITYPASFVYQKIFGKPN
eukprot:403334091